MRYLGKEDGVSLLTAMMFTLICLVMVLGLMQMLLSGSAASGSRKNYRNSLEAAYGGVELVTKEFIPRLYHNYSTGIDPLLDSFGGDPGRINLVLARDSLKVKLSEPTARWGSLSKSPNPKEAPDLQFQLKGETWGSNYNLFVKVVDTVPGNSDPTGVDYIESGAGVAGESNGIAMKHTPTLYSLEVQGESTFDRKEKALLSVLYAY